MLNNNDEAEEIDEELMQALRLSMVDGDAEEDADNSKNNHEPNNNAEQSESTAATTTTMPTEIKMTDPQTMSKIDRFAYLSIVYLLQVKHTNVSRTLQLLQLYPAFKQFIQPNEINADFCAIVNSTPFNSNAIEAILIDRFQKPFANSMNSFKYLMKSYDRCLQFEKRIQNMWDLTIPVDTQTEIIGHISRSIMTFCGLVLCTPDVTQNETDFYQSKQEFDRILTSEPKGRDFPPQFLQKLLSGLDIESLETVLNSSLMAVKTASVKVLNSNFRLALNALLKLCSVPEFSDHLLSQAWAFIPNYTPDENNGSVAAFKQKTIHGNTAGASFFGGFLNLGSETADIRQQIFQGLSANINSAQLVSSAFTQYRFIIHELQDKVTAIFQTLVKHSKGMRATVVRLCSYYLYINLDRGKMRFDPALVASNAFMLNLNDVLLSLCEPIVKRNLMKKIDSNYFLISGEDTFLDWTHATRMSADAHELKQATDELLIHDGNNNSSNNNNNNNNNNKTTKTTTTKKTAASFGFTTEIFCLTLESLHLGFSCIVADLQRLRRAIARMKREVKNAPAHVQFLIHARIQTLEQKFIGQTAHVLDKRFILKIGAFYSFFCGWILHLSQQPNHQRLLSVIPEYFIQDLSNYFKLFLGERQFVFLMMQNKAPFNKQHIIECLIYLMNETSPVRNIYQRACLCEVLFYFLPPKVLQYVTDNNNYMHNNSNQTSLSTYEFESHEFNRLTICRQSLVHALLCLYRDCERTGNHNQFYEKFQFRTFISKLLKFLFLYPFHASKLVTFYEENEARFIGFLNMLINDLIFCLDSGFDGLTEIKAEELVMNNIQQWNALNAEQQRDTTENLAQLKSRVRQHMLLANESIQLMQFAVQHCMQAFLTNDIILDRVSVMINVYLDRLSHGSEFKIKNLKTDYFFNAKYLLVSIVMIFNKLSPTPTDAPQAQNKNNTKNNANANVNANVNENAEDAQNGNGSESKFLTAIITDDVHFSVDAYKTAIKYLYRKQMLDKSEIDAFSAKFEILCAKAQENKNFEVMLGEIPSKYLDPIMQTLMKDPVILPDANKKHEYIMDRKVIERHLMNSENNPFNRQPLSIDELIPHTKLKQEIDEWVAVTIQQFRAKQTVIDTETTAS